MNSFRLNPDSTSTVNGPWQPELFGRDLSVPQERGSETLHTRVATTWQSVEDLRAVWQPWTNGLHTDIDYYLQNLKNDRTAISPYAISVWQGEIPLGILVGQVKERTASTTLSMVLIKGPRVRVLEIVTRGRLGPASAEVDGLLAAQLAKALRAGQAELVYLHRLPTNSSLFQKIWQLPSLLMRKKVAHVFSYSVVPLTAPAGGRPAVFSGKIMREARRKTANLRRGFPDQVKFRCFSQVRELPEGLGDVERVNEGAWQSALGADFTDPLQTVESFQFFAEKGWLRIYVLYVAERPCAFLIGQVHGKTFHCEHAGYHAEFGKYSVGSVLTSWAFENLAAAGVELVDLGEGGQEHNRRLGCERNEQGTVHVYAPTMRGLSLSLFFGAAQAGRLLGSWARTNLRLGWAAAGWREFLLGRRARMRAGEMRNRFAATNSSEPVGLAPSPRDIRACG